MPLMKCRGQQSRRDVLRVGSLALGGLGLPGLLSAREVSGRGGCETAVIVLFLHGGASQLETFDLKPEAPDGIRSVIRPIRSAVPGMDLCEHLSGLARISDRFTLIRSLNHAMSVHSDGQIEVMTGKAPTKVDPTSQSRGDHPDLGHITSHLRGLHPEGMPRYVAIPSALYATRPTYLGPGHAPFTVSDPSRDGFDPLKVAIDGGARSLEDRRGLLRQLDVLRRGVDRPASWDAMDRYQAQAFTLLTSSRVAEAFDLDREDAGLRDRNGRHRWGQGCLLARRLVEAETSIVSLFIDTPQDGPVFTNWDDHPGNAGRPGHFADYLRRRLAYLDQALSTLVADIAARGLDRRVLVVVTGEFGRTPRIRSGPPDGSQGRDHWPQAYSALVAGGGLRMGQVVGETDSEAAYPRERPVSPQDLLATVYRHLEIDTGHVFRDHLDRPFPILSEGRPIAEL
ncbi:DUF1501 domain-containing protein [Tautonia plasticadhaerens]|uniref:Sulfatase n=1 Tax=Tautonia plasticadhaerens TaxID=2527974 RepID=A0A518H6H2_9BACT|nr:DUF1501 domain-containing protein [Tautonia plasticadhaerens]QDV36424.1 hypothetical protein ElP_43480 [Tautonia plasticadhaerens]